jgi:anti-anti-sigma factor
MRTGSEHVGGVSAVSSLFAVSLERAYDEVIIRVHGDLDLSTAAELASAIELDCLGAARLTIDLSEVSFLDCAGLRVLLYARARAESNGGDLLLVRGRDSVQRVFRLAGLEDQLAFGEASGDPTPGL